MKCHHCQIPIEQSSKTVDLHSDGLMLGGRRIDGFLNGELFPVIEFLGGPRPAAFAFWCSDSCFLEWVVKQVTE